MLAPMKTLPSAALLASLALVAACGRKDDRLEQLTVGITKDSTLKVMGVERPARVDPFLIGGKYIEVMYYQKPGATDSVPDRDMSPLVTVDGVLIGWGWKTLDSVSAETRIPVAPK
jgi:hypothetical protein